MGLFLYEPELIEADDFDEAHLRFINESLRELRQALRDRGGELVLRRGEAVAELSRLHAEYNFDRIWAHQETTNQVAYQRDRRVRASPTPRMPIARRTAGVGSEATDEVVQKLFEVADVHGTGVIDTEHFIAHSETFLGGRPARIILVVGGPGSGKGRCCACGVLDG